MRLRDIQIFSNRFEEIMKLPEDLKNSRLDNLLADLKYSTDLRSIITVGYMIEHEKAVTAPTATATTKVV